MKQVAIIFLILFTGNLFFCHAQVGKKIAVKHIVTISFQNKVGNADLHLDSTYTDPFNEEFTVKQFKYYISNIQFIDDATKKTESFPAKYYLIDEANPSSKNIQLETTLENISEIKFLLGIDSIKNTSGIQTGSLDPAKGMFWAWNTGYVMAKLEGISPVANTAQHSFSWHIGGYKKNEKTSRLIALTTYNSASSSNNSIIINADAAKWFTGMHDIKISANPFCHEPGELAVSIADNYSGMFSISPAVP